MKKVSRAPYVMLALALIGIAVALYDAYAIYNGRLLWCPPPINGCNEVASNDGKLVGIVSRANLLHGIVAQQAGGNSSIDDRKIKAAVEKNLSGAGVRIQLSTL